VTCLRRRLESRAEPSTRLAWRSRTSPGDWAGPYPGSASACKLLRPGLVRPRAQASPGCGYAGLLAWRQGSELDGIGIRSGRIAPWLGMAFLSQGRHEFPTAFFPTAFFPAPLQVGQRLGTVPMSRWSSQGVSSHWGGFQALVHVKSLGDPEPPWRCRIPGWDSKRKVHKHPERPSPAHSTLRSPCPLSPETPADAGPAAPIPLVLVHGIWDTPRLFRAPGGGPGRPALSC
jgi:hypothetical protein